MTEPGKPRFETTALIMSVLLLVAALIGVYLPISAAKHIWPYGTDASAALEASTQNEVPAAYQHTWDGQIGIRFTRISIEISLKLGSGQVSDLVGSISSPTFGCAALVYLRGSGPVTLGFVASNSSGACRILSFINSATVTLLNSDSLKFTADIHGLSSSCDLRQKG